MRHPLFAITIPLLIASTYSKTAGQLCKGTAAKAADGNWYCSEVRTITYRNISQAGAYNRTTDVDPNTGLCAHEKVSYSGTGSLAPLFGQLSMHLRGPMNVSQIAVYSLGSSISKRPKQRSALQKGYINEDEGELPGHAVVRESHANPSLTSPGQAEDLVLRWANESLAAPTSQTLAYSTPPNYNPTECGTTVTMTRTITSIATSCEMRCAPIEIQSTSAKPSKGLSPLPSVSHSSFIQSEAPCSCTTQIPTVTSFFPINVTIDVPSIDVPTRIQVSTPSTFVTIVKRSTQTLTSPQEVTATAAIWKRIAYYTSTAPPEATGFAFLANLGDDRKSGTFDYAFGNSLSYVTNDGGKVAPQSTPFDGTLETSEIEIAAFTDQQCDDDCEFYRPKSTAHYGWDGADKAFFIEFQMDHYDNVGSDQGMLSDAPAWWFLNAAIPRILQYGNDRNNIPCSCWSTGCGEFDAFEVLGRGEERAKSTIHRQGNLEGGDSNYFKRPVGKMLKFAVVFHDFNITAAVLDNSFDFSQSLTEDAIKSIIAYDPNSSTHSLFAIGT